MEITHRDSFLAYFEKTRQITAIVMAAIPPDKIDWAYMPGKFTIADIIRHIAAIEWHVFAAIASGNKSSYTGCRKNLADGYEQVMAYFRMMHEQSMAIFRLLDDEALKRNIKSLDGRELALGNFLRALIVHEVHHRAVLVIYLNLLQVTTPPIIGLMEEQVIQLSK